MLGVVHRLRQTHHPQLLQRLVVISLRRFSAWLSRLIHIVLLHPRLSHSIVEHRIKLRFAQEIRLILLCCYLLLVELHLLQLFFFI